MKNFISKQTFSKRLFIVLTTMVVLFSLAYLSRSSFNSIRSFQLYYIKARLIASELKFLNIQKVDAKNQAKSVPVLLYHGIVPKSDGSNVTLDEFRNQMTELKKEGYETVSLQDFYSFQKGEKTLPDKSFLLTFDDGRKDSFYPVDPILEALNYKATIFVIAGVIDKNNAHLTTYDLKKAEATDRWDVESHTFNGHGMIKISKDGKTGHFLSSKMWLDTENRLETDQEYRTRITQDLIKSKQFLETNLNKKIYAFAFPYNDYGQEDNNYPASIQDIPKIVDSIFDLSFYQVGNSSSSFNYPLPGTSMIKRIDASPTWKNNDIITELSSRTEKVLPYSFPGSLDHWVPIHEKFSLQNNILTLGSSEIKTGNTVFLDSSLTWKNYFFQANIRLIQGSNAFLLARFKDESNYLACNFSSERIRIEQTINGQTQILAEKKLDTFLDTNNIMSGLKVNNNEIGCYIGDSLQVSNTSINNVLSNGGIGFSTWDKTLNNSLTEISKINVSEIK